MCSRYRARAPSGETVDAVPGAPAPVLAGPDGRPARLRWGLLPGWADGPDAKPQPHARAESLADRPWFRDAFRWRRALLPAESWLESPKRGADRSPWEFRLKDRAAFSFAGLWEAGTFAVVTVEPNAAAAAVHDRMPAVLAPGTEAEWLDPGAPGDRLAALLRPYPAALTAARRLGDVRQPELFL